MIFLDGLQGKAEGCLAKPKQHKKQKPRVLWIGEDVFCLKKTSGMDIWIKNVFQRFTQKNNRVQIFQRKKNGPKITPGEKPPITNFLGPLKGL